VAKALGHATGVEGIDAFGYYRNGRFMCHDQVLVKRGKCLIDYREAVVNSASEPHSQ
jgi:hypothetical protein